MQGPDLYTNAEMQDDEDVQDPDLSDADLQGSGEREREM
jgi:hypothetical protein